MKRKAAKSDRKSSDRKPSRRPQPNGVPMSIDPAVTEELRDVLATRHTEAHRRKSWELRGF